MTSFYSKLLKNKQNGGQGLLHARDSVIYMNYFISTYIWKPKFLSFCDGSCFLNPKLPESMQIDDQDLLHPR